MIRVAVLFDNFGPYHIARLAAAAQRCHLLGIEVASVSEEYAWQPTESVPFERKTLFRVDHGETKTPQELERRLEEELSAHSTEVIAVPGWSGYHAILALRVALRRSIAVVIMSESQEVDSSRTWFKEWVKRRYLKLCKAALVGGSPHQAYLEKLGMASGRIWQGYDIVDNGYFSGYADRARADAMSLRSRYSLPRRYFLASARFIEKKNLRRLIEAYAGYRHAKAGKSEGSVACLDLILLGDGELRPQLESLVARLGLQGFVHMPGFKQYPELPVFYGLASAFIHASTSEQWGLVVNEAMAAGLPVLVSDRCGCAPDLVKNGVNGFTFDPLDANALSALMLKIDDGERDLVCMGQASREIIGEWGPQAFGEALVKASAIAMQSEVIKFSIKERLLLGALMRLHV